MKKLELTQKELGLLFGCEESNEFRILKQLDRITKQRQMQLQSQKGKEYEMQMQSREEEYYGKA
jgi:hypothetical protein